MENADQIYIMCDYKVCRQMLSMSIQLYYLKWITGKHEILYQCREYENVKSFWNEVNCELSFERYLYGTLINNTSGLILGRNSFKNFRSLIFYRNFTFKVFKVS